MYETDYDVYCRINSDSDRHIDSFAAFPQTGMDDGISGGNGNPQYIAGICPVGNRPGEMLAIVKFTGDLTLSFRIDGMSMVFGTLAAALWPLAMLYAFS